MKIIFWSRLSASIFLLAKKNSIALNDNGIKAAQYAEKILAFADEAVEKLREFDRKNRTVSIGSYAPVPMHEIFS